MSNGNYNVRFPNNEPVLGYKEGSNERKALELKLKELKNSVLEIPLIIGGREVHTSKKLESVIPHNKKHVLARYSVAGKNEIQDSIKASLEAKKKWETMPWEHRAAIFLKAAELLAGPWRATINAATMLSQSKTIYQAEIDAACELIDFLRFNAYFMSQIYSEQPISTDEYWNRIDYRPLEGFVLAITPFNFTAIGGNLSISPALMGNVVLWKPANTAVLSNYLVMKLLEEAGLPKGVINFIPCPGSLIGDVCFQHPDFSGVHFTGSTAVFSTIWKTVGENIRKYKSYPKLVGETGGKDFVFAHSEVDEDELIASLIRGAYEYQGQKCSAASRAYIPKSLWPSIKSKLISEIETIKIGDVEDNSNFMSAVIDQSSFDNIRNYLDFVEESDDGQILTGGLCDDSIGYFVKPTLIQANNPYFKTMVEEIFGPVLTVYVYDDEMFEETLDICDKSTPYGLTGAIFSKNREALAMMETKLSHAAGNLYINDKPTGAVVGQQPFGGARASGTNDKAGSKLNLLRWTNPRVIKEVFNTPKDYRRSLN